MNEPQGADSLLTPQELAELCRVPLATVFRWNARGGGPARITIGRHVRYSRAEVERWLASRTTPAAERAEVERWLATRTTSADA